MVYVRDGLASKRNSGQLAQRYEVLLPRRSLQIQQGAVRYDYRHSIPNHELLSDRRVSVTFRQNISGMS